jgi:hypothetical protein
MKFGHNIPGGYSPVRLGLDLSVKIFLMQWHFVPHHLAYFRPPVTFSGNHDRSGCPLLRILPQLFAQAKANTVLQVSFALRVSEILF